MGFKFEDKFFYDKNLPQGCASSCRIFETFATALQAIFEHEVIGGKCIHMIDDFFFIADNKVLCLQHRDKFLNICQQLGVPIAPDKTTAPATDTTFLGIKLDTKSQVAKLPPEKLAKYTMHLKEVMQKNKLKREDLESLTGKLSFAASVVPARPFLRRLFDLIYTVKKPHHFIRLTKQTHQDLTTWLHFLENYNGITFFRYQKLVESTAIHLVSDASKQGFGGCFGTKWIQGFYPQDWQHFHITILEFFPIFVLVSMFGHLMANSSIIFLCDNKAVVEIINKQSSKDKTIMNLVRPLVLKLISHNILFVAKHIEGKRNILADKISRFQATPELLAQYMNPQPTPVPVQLWPENFTLKWCKKLRHPCHTVAVNNIGNIGYPFAHLPNNWMYVVCQHQLTLWHFTLPTCDIWTIALHWSVPRSGHTSRP